MQANIYFVMAFFAVYHLARFLYHRYRLAKVRRRAHNRRQQRDAKKFNIPEVSPEKTQLILQSDITQLRQLQIDGRCTSVEIVSVFAKRCHKIGRDLNLVTEEYYDEALVEAK